MGVIDLQASDPQPCPGRPVVLTATTDPPAGSVTWSVGNGPHDTFTMVGGVPLLGTHFDGDGNLILPAGVTAASGDTITMVGTTGQTRDVTATHGDQDGDPPVTSRSVTVRWREASANVELVPPGPYLINATPRLPAVTVVGAGTLSVSARLGLRRFDDCPPHGPLDLDTTLEVPVGPGGLVDLGDVVRGGVLTVTAEGTVNGCPVTASASGGIRGTNPPGADVQTALPHDTLRRIACKESGQRQFDAPSDGGVSFCPLFGVDGRVGVMQIPDPTPDEVWNWRRNVQRGIARFEQKVADAAAYPGRVRDSARFAELVAEFNTGRQQAGLPPLAVALSDFTTGNFDDDLRQLELDAVRGYDGWFGGDGFGHELHEFRVRTEEGIPELLIVTEIDEAAHTGRATWARVPVGDRPTAPGDPNYVAGVLGLLPSCSGGADGGVELFPCQRVTITTTGLALSFDPPSVSAVTVVEGRVEPGSLSSAMHWCMLPGDGWRGTVAMEEEVVGTVVRARLLARHPGKMRLALQRGRCEDGLPPPMCEAKVNLSVPQFFFLHFVPEFALDLERLGLRRAANPDGSPLTAEQVAANDQARAAVIEAAAETAIGHFPDVNVRFVTASPAALVGAGNFTTVQIGGLSPDGVLTTQYGAAPVDAAKRYNPDKETHVRAGEFARRGGPITDDPLYRAVFDPLATQDAGSGALAGIPVDSGEVVVAPATRRQQIVRAATTAFGRFIGSVAAHEAGHVLIPAVSPADLRGFHELNTLMMPGGATLAEKTGIVAFDPATSTFAVGPPLGFGPWYRKRLRARYPTQDIMLSEYD